MGWPVATPHRIVPLAAPMVKMLLYLKISKRLQCPSTTPSIKSSTTPPPPQVHLAVTSSQTTKPISLPSGSLKPNHRLEIMVISRVSYPLALICGDVLIPHLSYRLDSIHYQLVNVDLYKMKTQAASDWLNKSCCGQTKVSHVQSLKVAFWI